MRIFNWVFGSFFRTFGRFLFYIVIGALVAFFLSENVSALEFNYNYVNNYEVPVRTTIAHNNGTSLELGIGTMGDILINSTTDTTPISTRAYQYNTYAFTMGTTYETWIKTYTGRQIANHLYSYSLLVCSNKQIPHSSFNIGLTSYTGYYFPLSDYKSQAYSSTSKFLSEYVAANTLAYCYDVSGYGSYRQDTTTVSLSMKPTTAISDVRLFLMGYKIEDLGYYHENLIDDIENIIDTNMGNVATKSDINEVNKNINKINEEIQNVNDSITNSDTSGANSDASGFFDNFQSNDHGLTGIITTPLNLINSITSKTCSPLILPSLL